jgi:hypothetical protein
MKWLSVPELAKIYGMTPKSIHRMVDKGLLKAVVFPTGTKRISSEALVKELRRSTRKHGASFDESAASNDSTPPHRPYTPMTTTQVRESENE